MHHLDENTTLYSQGKWDSSISHARNFVEQLLSDIAEHIKASKKDSTDLSKPFKIREYLQTVGFFDESERKKLVEGIYGFFSEEGSHPGISSEGAARACNQMLQAIGLYLLEKYESAIDNASDHFKLEESHSAIVSAINHAAFKVTLTNPDDFNLRGSFTAKWEQGSSLCLIKRPVVEKLSLVSKTGTMTVALGKTYLRTGLFKIDIQLPNGKLIDNASAICENGIGEADVLLGQKVFQS